MHPVLTNFHILRPSFLFSQAETLSWIASAHTKSESSHGNKNVSSTEFHENIKNRLHKLGVGPEKIKERGLSFPDFSHQDWENMEIFSLSEKKEGKDLSTRSFLFDREASKKLEEFYPQDVLAPHHLIHVSCTGYVAPSPAQKLVSLRGFGKQTAVTHAYHMGCYGSIPALRMANGFFLTKPRTRVDIVHTEICSLHMNPSLHEIEQLVVQTLFADGFIKYSLLSEESVEENTSYLQVLTTHEEILPASLDKMSWKCENWGLRMTLSKEIPFLISEALPAFVSSLFTKAEISEKEKNQAIFAVHPGGPKIISQVGSLLHLEKHQISHSEEVLRNFGNMSSATLPHIWESILKDKAVPSSTLIVCLAFGPGLTMSGALLRKKERE